MVLLGCALDMMPLRVYATTYLELMAPSLDLGAPGAPKTTICPLNMQISLIVASIFLSMLFMVQFRCALNMTLLCVFATIALELMAISLGLRASGAPEMTSCPLNMTPFLIRANLSGQGVNFQKLKMMAYENRIMTPHLNVR